MSSENPLETLSEALDLLYEHPEHAPPRLSMARSMIEGVLEVLEDAPEALEILEGSDD